MVLNRSSYQAAKIYLAAGAAFFAFFDFFAFLAMIVFQIKLKKSSKKLTFSTTTE
jgi:hypothetical protein